jgi:transposase
VLYEIVHRIFTKKLPNDRELILEALQPYKDDIVGIVVESTYKRYRLVDLLMEAGTCVMIKPIACLML